MLLPRLYPIVDVVDDDAIPAAVELARALSEAGCEILQVRAKTLTARAFVHVTERVADAIAASRCQLVVNDRADVALITDADGVHVGDEDLPVAAARAVLPKKAIVGFSTHSVAEARDAEAATGNERADYLGFGPVFASPTKAGVREARGIEMLREVCSVTSLPVVAIGGVTLETAPELWAAGAASVAVISDLRRDADPAAVVSAYLRASRSIA